MLESGKSHKGEVRPLVFLLSIMKLVLKRGVAEMRDILLSSKHAKLLCDRWKGWLKRRFPGMQLYGFRHAWAIRSISKVPSTSIAAKCMGHDIAVHHREYHRWLDQADIAAVAIAMQSAA